MKTSELQKKSRKELQKLLSETREAVRKEKFGLAGSKSRNTMSIRDLKKDVARIMTALNNKTE